MTGFNCRYQTDINGRLVHYNANPDYVEQMYQIRKMTFEVGCWVDELEEFNYEEYKLNNFKVNKLGDYPLKLETKPE